MIPQSGKSTCSMWTEFYYGSIYGSIIVLLWFYWVSNLTIDVTVSLKRSGHSEQHMSDLL